MSIADVVHVTPDQVFQIKDRLVEAKFNSRNSLMVKIDEAIVVLEDFKKLTGEFPISITLPVSLLVNYGKHF